MSRRTIGVVVTAGAAVLALVFASASSTRPSAAATIYFGMDAPLTGPTTPIVLLLIQGSLRDR